jgi:hypothetical protein
MIAAHRQRQTLAAERQRFRLDRIVARQRRDRRRRQFDRQPDARRAARNEEVDRRLVERVDERSADERPQRARISSISRSVVTSASVE